VPVVVAAVAVKQTRRQLQEALVAVALAVILQ
jgi:hypothetical protein